MFDDETGSPERPWKPPAEREPPAMDHEPGWKESAYRPEMGRLILARLEAGETLKQVTADPRMPSYATVYRWTHVHEDFGEAWRMLRDMQAADRRWRLREGAKARAWRYAHERKLAGKPPRAWKSGKRSTYTACMAMRVCFALEQGASLSEVVKRPGMPSSKAIYRWLRNEPWFRDQYARACDLREFIARETVIDIALEADVGTFRRAKREVAAIDGRIGRMRPRTYRL